MYNGVSRKCKLQGYSGAVGNPDDVCTFDFKRAEQVLTVAGVPFDRAGADYRTAAAISATVVDDQPIVVSKSGLSRQGQEFVPDDWQFAARISAYFRINP